MLSFLSLSVELLGGLKLSSSLSCLYMLLSDLIAVS